MTASWFGTETNSQNECTVNIKDAVKVLYPQKSSRCWGGRNKDRSRFNTLLLEHGEKRLQDWAVIAYTNPKLRRSTSNNGPGRSGRRLSSTRTHKNVEKDLDKDAYPSVHLTKIEGRLHLCTKSLLFEPSDFARPIIRCPFNKMDSPPKEYPNKTEDPAVKSFEAMTIEFESCQHVTMKGNNSIAPFESIPVNTRFRFTFLHSSPTSFVDLCKRLFTIWHNYKSKTGNHYHNQSSCMSELEQLLKPMIDKPFDPVNLLDVRERVLTSNIRCNLLTPLQEQPGCMVVTQERMYFQPSLGVISIETTSQATTWFLQRDLQATARRYYGLKDSALELYWKDGSSNLLGFERKHEREQVLRLLPTQRNFNSSIPCHTDREFIVQASQEWQRGNISNYDYLLLLNSAAGRTTQDLSRYPVFPWIIADYESNNLDLTKEETFRDLTKPIGALNAERLEYFQRRFEGMSEMKDSFLYGTHYSAAGYVLYYLVRSMPEHMLCLQNGKFDAPDRMFHSISQCHSCVLSNHADLKELIPEFYNPNNDFDFLINTRSLQLGATQNGERVNDVSLPKWAKSPKDFLKKNIKALESDICTAALPRWIDLIFGNKSRHEAAKEANNLFLRSAYLGPSDLSVLPTQEERFQVELQATEFGIVPDQLFTGRHPLRHETVDDSFINPDVGRSFRGTDDGKTETWELLESPSPDCNELQRENRYQDQTSIEGSQLNNNTTQTLSSVSPQSLVLNTSEQYEEEYQGERKSPKDRMAIPISGSGDIRDATGDYSRLSSFSRLGKVENPISPRLTNNLIPLKKPNIVISSQWDIRFIEKKKIHEDAISGCSMFPIDRDKYMLVTSSLDGRLKVHIFFDSEKKSEGGITETLSRFSYITMSRGNASPTDEHKLTEYRSLSSRDPLACLSIVSDPNGGKIAFTGGHDDVVLAYGINSACAVASIYSHRDAVTGLDVLYRPPLTMHSALWPKNATHCMVSGSWDATIKVWSVVVANGETVSIDREPLAELFDCESPIVCVSAVAFMDSLFIAAGSENGSFCVWNLLSDGIQVVIHQEPARRGGPCSVVKWSSEGDRLILFTGFGSGKVASYSLVDGVLQKGGAVSVGVAVQSMMYSEDVLIVGCSDGGLRLIPLLDGIHFTSDLTLWPAINNKVSPGLTSVDLSIMKSSNDDSRKCVCCTAGEDGSIALFEIKQASKN